MVYDNIQKSERYAKTTQVHHSEDISFHDVNSLTPDSAKSKIDKFSKITK